LKELERKRFQEAKARLRDFVINFSDSSSDEELLAEQARILRYYKHRFITFVGIMKESLIAKRVKPSNNIKGTG